MSIARAAQVQNGEVLNIIMVSLDAEGNPNAVLPGCEVVLLPGDLPVGKGWAYKDGEFSDPSQESPVELAPTQEETPSFELEGQPLEVAESQTDFEVGSTTPVEDDNARY